jgi:protein arginine N-methyltransferase 2
MQSRGWINSTIHRDTNLQILKQPEIRVLSGKWQDAVHQLYNDGIQFNAIFFDTFGETYEAMREWHDHVVNLLNPHDGIYSFFNGLGGTNPFFNDVYCRIVEVEMNDLGMQVEWHTVPVDVESIKKQQSSLKRPYFTLGQYRLPQCRFIAD